MPSFLIFIIAFLCLLFIFLRRFKLTKHDLALQEQLLKAEVLAKEAKSEEVQAEIIQSSTSPAPADHLRAKIDNFLKQAEDRQVAGKTIEVKKILNHILSLDKNNIEAQKKLGCIFLQENEDKKAEQMFRNILASTDDPVAYSNLGLALFKQQQFAEAAFVYEKSLALDDSRPARFISLAHVYLELGEDTKALKNFEEASRREPKNVEYLFIIADFYQKRGDSLKIRETLDKILDVEPFNEDAKKKLTELGIPT